jgi:predicted metalloendopeptidase
MWTGAPDEPSPSRDHPIPPNAGSGATARALWHDSREAPHLWNWAAVSKARRPRRVREDIDAILAITDHAGVARWMARPVSHAIVGAYVFPDETDTRRTFVHLDQQTLGPRILGLPSRAYYEDGTGDYPALRMAYRDHIVRMLELAGVTDADVAQADAGVALEDRLAAVLWNAEHPRRLMEATAPSLTPSPSPPASCRPPPSA